VVVPHGSQLEPTAPRFAPVNNHSASLLLLKPPPARPSTSRINPSAHKMGAPVRLKKYVGNNLALTLVGHESKAYLVVATIAPSSWPTTSRRSRSWGTTARCGWPAGAAPSCTWGTTAACIWTRASTRMW
jgi:hypothetical protein